ncbi:ATP-grasp domain-containing protein [Prevotella sp. P6B1]|uniref:ATP-grasp domain-containing protein n=1 Tax=Prevotella sp. P6B1 TaxID=1410613 RepID=UPI00051BD24C|nr:ATP-grasp domain-containing protein [Prevotella sp. P6B1]
MSKKILVFPGTQWQVPLIEKIQEMGHQALVVNPDPEAPGMKKADMTLISDIFDKDKVVAFGIEQHIDAVMSDECDIAMNMVAELGKAFNVPAMDEETAALFTDKFLMREFSKKHGLKYPEYKFCKTVDDAIALQKEINKPIIIKPLDSNASHGVFKCSNEEEIRKHFDESMSFSRVEKSVLAERFIVGTEFTIDGVKTPHGHYTMAISEKKHFAHNESIANELLFSHYNPYFDYDKLRATNDAFVMKSNLQFGFTHAEYKFEDGEFYLIEIAARGGGNMISSCITQYMTGYDTYRYLVECATGNVHDEDFSLRPEYKERAAVLKFFETPGGGGKVREIKGLDYIENEPDIKHYRLNFKVGDTIEDALNDSVRIGFYIVCSENMQKLREVISNVQKNFQILY